MLLPVVIDPHLLTPRNAVFDEEREVTCLCHNTVKLEETMKKLFWCLFLPAALITWMCIVDAYGHDPDGNAAVSAWLMEQHSNDHAWCCDGKDAHYLNETEWGIEQGHYYVIISGLKIAVTDGQLVKTTSPNITGHAVLWYATTERGDIIIRCFIAGEMT